MSKISKVLVIASALVLVGGAPAAAQAATGDTVDVTTNDTVDVTTEPRDDDDDFPWGLLGLLGLAGLMGRKRRDDEVHVNRTNNTTNRL